MPPFKYGGGSEQRDQLVGCYAAGQVWAARPSRQAGGRQGMAAQRGVGREGEAAPNRPGPGARAAITP